MLGALVFDTTSSNSGWKSGAAKLLEKKIGCEVFYNACWHHVYELVRGNVWRAIFGKSMTGPENVLFNQFKRNWENIDKSKLFNILEIFNGWLKDRAKSC